MLCSACWTPASSGICLQRTLAVKCAAGKVRYLFNLKSWEALFDVCNFEALKFILYKSGHHKVCKTMKWHFATLYYVVTKKCIFSNFQSRHPLSRFQLCTLWTFIQPTFWAVSWDDFNHIEQIHMCAGHLMTAFPPHPVQLIKHLF